MANIDNIIERQHQLHGVISRAVENLKKLGPSKTNRGNVQSRIEALKSNWDKFQAHHESLFKNCSAEQRKLSYFKDDLYSQCEEEFLNAHGTLLNVLNSFGQTDHQHASAAEISLNSSSVSRSRRLPRIDVPKFSGDYAQWSHFRDLSTSMIVENPDIAAVEKLHYLKMSLSGEPSQHLRNITVSSENFARAWDTLVARYDNKRILIDAQLAALFATRRVKSESAADLKRLLGDVKEALGALEALACPVNHWDLLTIFMMVRKLDSESLKRWEDTLGAQSDPPSFADFEAFLVSRIYTLEALERALPRKPQQTTSTSPRPSTGARAYTAAATEQKCPLCDSGHYLSSCPTYLGKTQGQRREVVVSKNLCFNCLGPHQLRTCRNIKRCRICRKQHHTTLHVPTGNVDATSTATYATSSSAAIPSTSQANVPVAPRNAEPSQTSTHVARSRVVCRAPVLLATAAVTVRYRSGNSSQVRALIDQGSEVSFVSESIAQSLRLPRRAAAIPILGIGAQRNSVSNGLASLIIASRINTANSFEIEALVLPKLTAYLPPAQVEPTQWSHLQGLQLADPDFATPGKIDLILGANVYTRILEEGLCRGSIGAPIAQKTSLGWILSGPLSNERVKDSPAGGDSVTGLQCSLDFELLDLLQRFWTQEEIVSQTQASLTPEETHK